MPSTPNPVVIGAQRRVEFARRRPIPRGVRAPAGMRQDDIAGGVARTIGLKHLADTLPGYHFADPDRPRVGFPIVHAAAHVGIERQIEDPQQKTSGGQRRHRRLFQTEVLRHRRPIGPRRQHDLCYGRLVHGSLPRVTLGAHSSARWERRNNRGLICNMNGKSKTGGRSLPLLWSLQTKLSFCRRRQPRRGQDRKSPAPGLRPASNR